MNAQGSHDLIVVSNRLPMSLVLTTSGYSYKPSAGGLATALSGLRRESFLWVGWPGAAVPDSRKEEVRRELLSPHRCFPVFLTPEQIEHFYNRFCNGVLWPLFHYLPEYTDFELEGWAYYQEVNQLFAQVVGELAPPKATIWIHDYHLMLLPRLLRERLPDARIGFFLHIPFPSSEVYRLLPVRRHILEGLLGADVVGFHTYDYARHFRSACLRVLGYEATPDVIDVEGRPVRLAVAPIGIDAAHFEKLARSQRVQARLRQLRSQFTNCKVVLGVDRLDYSKGLTHKLRAFERFLQRYPQWRGRCVLFQVAVPSRTGVERYRQLRREVEELVGHINGLYSSVEHTAVHFLFQEVSAVTLSALYQLGDVCWVSSIRDGMNLVSQEYVISQVQGNGALVLSEFTGAAQLLDGAILTNPWNADQMAEALHQALEMPEAERRSRLERMQSKVRACDCRQWASKFLRVLDQHFRLLEQIPTPRNLLAVVEELLEAYRTASRRFLLLDYDGTLRPFAPTPQEAAPSRDVCQLLEALASAGQAHVYVVSGRDAATLEAWLGELPIGLCAEHGVWLREPGSRQWIQLVEVSRGWFCAVRPILESYASMTPGALVEEKSAALAWHYRRCDPDLGEWQAKELAFHLRSVVGNLPVEVTHGHKVIEVRAKGASKAALVRYLSRRWTEADFLFAAGDDATDEEMFQEMPAHSWTCRVGRRSSAAFYYVDRPADLRRVLELMAGVAKPVDVVEPTFGKTPS
jgi:trehalose 6-phosphate synthase/phosphatase